MFNDIVEDLKNMKCNSKEDYITFRNKIRPYIKDLIKLYCNEDNHISIDNNLFAEYVVNGSIEIVYDDNEFIIVEYPDDWIINVFNEKRLNKAPMSLYHKFIIPKDLRWTNINGITLGMDGNIKRDINILNKMKQIVY
jgi:hypothetical protein